MLKVLFFIGVVFSIIIDCIALPIYWLGRFFESAGQACYFIADDGEPMTKVFIVKFKILLNGDCRKGNL